MRFELPESISTRRDGLQLWLHLIERGVAYHWEDDPADYANETGAPSFTADECVRLRRLNEQVSASPNQRITDDACRLFKFATYLGCEMIRLVDIDDEDSIYASFQRLKRARGRREQRRRRGAVPLVDASLFTRAA